jgi:hypothetical protein
MEREEDDGGWMQESQLRLTGRNHPNIMVEMRTRPVRFLQLDTAVGHVGVAGDRVRVGVGLSGREELAMGRTMSRLREESGHDKQGAQEESRPTSSAVFTHRL